MIETQTVISVDSSDFERWACGKFRNFILGKRIQIIADHMSHIG